MESMKKRKGVIALLAVALLSLAVMQRYRSTAELRVLYAGENVYAMFLVTARYSCARKTDFQDSVKKIENFTFPLSINHSLIDDYEDFGITEGKKYCSYVIFTNIGTSASFELNYTYRLIGFRNDIGTGRITRIYFVEAQQKFKLPQYDYVIVLDVNLTPNCENILNGDGTIEIPLGTPCVLRDNWGTEILIPGGG